MKEKLMIEQKEKNYYGKCPKILYIKVSDKLAYANSTAPDQLLLEEQSD